MIPSANLRDCVRRTYLWVRVLVILSFCLAAVKGFGAETRRLGLVLIAPTAAGTPNIALNARHPLWVKWPPVNDPSGTQHMVLVRLGRLLDVSEGLFNVREDANPVDPNYPYRPLLPERLKTTLQFGKSGLSVRPRTPFRLRTQVSDRSGKTTINRLLLPLTLGESWAPNSPPTFDVWVTEAKSWDEVAVEAAQQERVLVVEYPPLQNRDHSRLWLWKGFPFGNAAKLHDVPGLAGSIPGLLRPETLLTLLIEPERMPTTPLVLGPDDDPSMWVQFLAERGRALTTGMLILWAVTTIIGFVLVAREVANGLAVGLLMWSGSLPAVVFVGSHAHRVVEVTSLPLVYGVLVVILLGGIALLQHRLSVVARPSEDGILAVTQTIGWFGTVCLLVADPIYSLFSPSARPWSVPWPSEFTAALVAYSCLIPLARPVWTPRRLFATILLAGLVLAKLVLLYGESPAHLATIISFTLIAWLSAVGVRLNAVYLVVIFNPFVLKQFVEQRWSISKFGAQSATIPEFTIDFFGTVPGLGAWSVLLVGCVIAGLALFSNAYSGYRLRRTAFGRSNLRWIQVTTLAVLGLILTEPTWIGIGGTFLMVTVPPVLALGAHEPELF